LWGLPLAISTMHIAWGLGFLWSGVSSIFKKMADIYRPSLRLRPGEQRFSCCGDFIASASATAGAIYFWYQYSLYRLIERVVAPTGGAPDSDRCPVLVLPSAARLAFVDGGFVRVACRSSIGARHCAESRSLRSWGCWDTPCFLPSITDPNSLPRIAVGAFLVLASFLTLGWRAIYIRLYTSSGLMRRVLIVGAGKAGHTGGGVS
jgi:hypothetical protein